MPEQVEMPDTMEVMRAIQDPAARDAMLDTMPGGEMARSTGPPSVTFSSATSVQFWAAANSLSLSYDGRSDA